MATFWAALWYPAIVLLAYALYRYFRKLPIADERRRKWLRILGIFFLAGAIGVYAQNNPDLKAAYFALAGIGLGLMILTMQKAVPLPKGRKKKSRA